MRDASPAAISHRAGAAKMSIYRHFAGKDDLVAAALAEREPRHRGWLVGSEVPSPDIGTVLEVFDRVASAADGTPFTGCPYVNACLELRDARHPAVAVAREHKQLVVADLRARLSEVGVKRPARLARTLLMLLDGATVHAVLAGSGAPLREARDTARALVAIALEGAADGSPA